MEEIPVTVILVILFNLVPHLVYPYRWIGNGARERQLTSTLLAGART